MSNVLSKKSIERYSRQIVLKNIGPVGQKKIIKSKVLVVGAGGLGCPVIDYLSRVKCLNHLIAGLSEFTEGIKFSDKLIEKCIMNEYQLIDQWTKWIQEKITENNSEH